MTNILMGKYKIKLTDFLDNPTGLPFGNIRKLTLNELQPIVIYSKNNNKDRKCLISALDFLDIEYSLNPKSIETPLRGYPIHLDEIELTW